MRDAHWRQNGDSSMTGGRRTLIGTERNSSMTSLRGLTGRGQ